MADPMVVLYGAAIKTRIMNREKKTMVDMARRWRQVETALLADIEALVTELQKEGIKPSVLRDQQYQLRRMRSLLEQARKEYNKFANYATKTISAEQKYGARTGIDAAEKMIHAVTGPAVKLDFDRLPFKAVQFMIGHVADGSTLGSHLKKSFVSGWEGMIEELVIATATGKNPRQTAKDMVRKGFSKSLNNVLTTARTEQLRVMRESQRLAYAHSKVVTGYMRSAARDSRTCIGCLAADGWVYELKEHFKSHPTCRCAILPVVKGFAPPTWEKGPEWFAKQKPETQLKMLGPTRLKAYQEKFKGDLGKFVHQTHNPTWGDGIVTASLKQLGLKQIKREEVQPAPQPEPETVQAPEPITEFRKFGDSLRDMEAWGDQHFAQWNEELEWEERQALEAYGASYYRELNQQLRTGTVIDESAQNMVRHMDRAIQKGSLPEDVVSYRGMNHRDIAENLDSMLGAVITDKAFVSTSLDRDKSARFSVRGDPDRAVLLHVKLKKGQRAAWLENITQMEEMELLLPRESQFIVTKVYKETIETRSGKMIPLSHLEVELI